MGREDEQVTCLVNEGGAGIKYMDWYDNMPSVARKMLANANLNICPACVDPYQNHPSLLLSEIQSIERKDRKARGQYCCF
jgi:hypothetical protein